jgi:hypothetical protein
MSPFQTYREAAPDFWYRLHSKAIMSLSQVKSEFSVCLAGRRCDGFDVDAKN